MDCEPLSGYFIYRRDREGRVGGQVFVAIKSGLQNFYHLDLVKENTVLIVNCWNWNAELYFCDLVHFMSSVWFLLRDCRWIELFSSRQRWVKSHWFGRRCIYPLLIGLPIYRCLWLFTGNQVVDNKFCELVGDNFLLQFVFGDNFLLLAQITCLEVG